MNLAFQTTIEIICYARYLIQKMDNYEITKLKKQLQRKQQLLKQEREDRQNTQKRLVQVQAERDRFHSELVIARQTIQNVDMIIAQNIKEMKAKLEQENAQSFNQLQKYKDKLIEEKLLMEKMEEESRNKDTVISELSLRLKQMSRKYKDNSLLVNTKQIVDQAALTNNSLYKLTQKYNKLCSDMENIMAQNKILRKLHGVPDNFGFDLEQIKIAEKQELEDYKAQCRKLQSEIEELQGERTQLRYRLRQYNTLYSNKGDRYKDMTQQQLDMLDQYALNLKEGKVQLPQIDKTQKQMERQIIKLKAQIEVLQNKAAPAFSQRGSDNNEKLSIEALRKMQEQFGKLITPLREEMKKITEMNFRPNEGDMHHQNNININLTQNNFRPPMPLPISHNDWTHIKEGFSYLYNSKIPIDLKDMNDETGFNIVKAKYEVAALQLQNIQSLKLLKEKQSNEDKLFTQLNQLKGKYQKCLKIQDDIYMRFFKNKEESNERVRQLQIQKNTLKNEKSQVEAQLSITTQSLNSISKKTQIEKRVVELTSRLAISQSELMKITRKYQILNQEHKLLRTSNTSLEAKTAANQYTLKEKIAHSKKNEKQLTFYLNKILDDSKLSVSGDVHKALLNRMQSLNDKSMNNSIKQTQLRIKINQLQNIEREINVKDDIIQTLRQDNFDINLQLQIIKNRLESSDNDYRTFQNVLRRFISFINQNNISVSNYFKKFDKDNSGELSKNQFLAAIRGLGFTIENNQFQLMFSEFDLDGSQSITYKEFIRKMRRSGVFTKNKQEEAMYRLFKAIKQANISIKKAFQIIDMDGSNSVTKTQMESAFRNIGIDITAFTIDYIFKMCDNDLNGSISCNQFEKLFQDIVREGAIQQKQIFNTQLDWKLAFILKMEEISIKYHKGGLQQTFNSLDKDGSKTLTINQFTELFKQSGVQLPRKQTLELFEFMDRHRDQKIEYFQFLKLLEEAKRQKKRIDRLKYIKVRTQELRKQMNLNKSQQNQSNKIVEEKALAIKLMSLQTKHTSLIKKTDKLVKVLANKEQQIIELNNHVTDLEHNVDKVREQYYKEKQIAIRLQQKAKNRISQEESKKLNISQNKLKIQNQEWKNQLELYKNLYQNLANKNKYDQMRIVKIQSEVQKYYQLVKQFQSTSDLNADLGAAVYKLELSKRNEEIVNKKYDQIIQQLRTIRNDNLKLSQDSLEKERQIINIHFFLEQRGVETQKTIDQLTAKIMPTVNASKIEDILSKIRVISNSKTQLEKENKELKDLNFNIQVRNDYIQNQKIHIEQLEKRLKRTYNDQSSLTIIDLTKKLSQYKMGELKAKRQCSLLKEKQEYYLRINNANTDNIKDLEEELGNWQKKYNEREQFWRKRMSEHMKLMEDMQKEQAKNREEERKAEVFFSQKQIQNQKVQEKYNNLPEDKQLRISSFINRSNNNNENIVFDLKSKIHDLEQQLQSKERQIYQLKSTFKQIVPQGKFSDFNGQMSVSTTNFVLQTDLTTSQLKNNARRFISNQKQQQNYYKDEAIKLTQAAQQSIDTLQKMIDQKNQQLKRKDHTIEIIKKEFMKGQDQDHKKIQLLNEEIRSLKTKAQIQINQFMQRPTDKNFYPQGSKNTNQIIELKKYIQAKQEEMEKLKLKCDRLSIKQQGKNGQNTRQNQKKIERKLLEIQEERQVEKKKFLINQERLNLKITNLQKLSKEKDIKLTRLQKTLIDLKNLAITEPIKIQIDEIQDRKDFKQKNLIDNKNQQGLKMTGKIIQDEGKKMKNKEIKMNQGKEDKLSKTAYRK